MKVGTVCLWFFLSVEACFGLIILMKFAPAALKAGSMLGLAGAVVAAVPWSLLIGASFAIGRWALRNRSQPTRLGSA